MNKIVSISTAYRSPPLPPGADPSLHEARILSGERMLMADGSAWFHPYNGAAPWRLVDEKAQ